MQRSKPKILTLLFICLSCQIFLGANCRYKHKPSIPEAEIIIETHWLALEKNPVKQSVFDAELLSRGAFVFPYETRKKSYILEQDLRKIDKKGCQPLSKAPTIIQGPVPKGKHVFVQMRLSSTPSSSIHTFKDTLKVFSKKYCAEGVSILKASQVNGQHHFSELWAKAWNNSDI